MSGQELADIELDCEPQSKFAKELVAKTAEDWDAAISEH